jgi:hypothetical protein
MVIDLSNITLLREVVEKKEPELYTKQALKNTALGPKLSKKQTISS